VSSEDKKNRPEGKEEFLPFVGVVFGCCHDYIYIYMYFINEN